MRSLERDLESIRRFFILRYEEEAKANTAALPDGFPLLKGYRLDLALVNGSSRVHFLYRRGGTEGNVVVVRHITLGPGEADEPAERRMISMGISEDEVLAHFVLQAPFTERFDYVEEQAVTAAKRHANAA
ncbi:MAG: hypothetical protein HY556_01655 [Euryarchaeota archaeon]|nr:hypothetical protein [Euryarchaeota archaeon]